MEQCQLNDAMIEEAGKIFAALGDPSRLKLLRLLMAAPGPLTLGFLADSAGLSTANTSKHLGCLMRAGLVAREKSGSFCHFRLAGSFTMEACSLIRRHVVERTQSAYRALA